MSYIATKEIKKAIRNIAHIDLNKMTVTQKKKFITAECRNADVSPRAMLDYIRTLRTYRAPKDTAEKLHVALTNATKLYRIAIA